MLYIGDYITQLFIIVIMMKHNNEDPYEPISITQGHRGFEDCSIGFYQVGFRCKIWKLQQLQATPWPNWLPNLGLLKNYVFTKRNLVTYCSLSIVPCLQHLLGPHPKMPSVAPKAAKISARQAPHTLHLLSLHPAGRAPGFLNLVSRISMPNLYDKK